jgi:tetratricopeptide (TPR) repeat protein
VQDLVLHLKRTTAPQPAQANFTVSVRELAIPTRAHQAFEKGLQQLAKNDSAGSLSDFTRAARVFPGYYEAYYQIGVANMNLGREEEAEHAFQTAIDLSAGRYVPAQYGMGALFCRQGKFADAERTIRWVLDRDANSWTGPYLLAIALAGLNRLEEAEKRVRAAIFRKPDFPLAHLLLGEIRFRRNAYEPALHELDAYFKLEPHGPMNNWARQIREQAQRGLFKSPEASAPPSEKP